jgi:hypothetical protein
MTNLFIKHRNRILYTFYFGLVIWWLSIYFRQLENTTENYLYSLTYGLIPLIWGISGFQISHYWGGFKSTMGKSVRFLSLGLFTWAIGNIIFAYYNLALDVEVPYPSIADYIFVLSFPFWIVGMLYLSRVTGMYFSLRELKGKIAFLIIPLIAIVSSYYLLFEVARGGEIDTTGGLEKLVFDIAFPVGDALILTIGLMLYGLSFNYLGGRLKFPIVITLVGFAFAYITDFSYSYTTTLGTFFVANWVDLFYTTTFFLLALGITSLDPRSIESK